MIASALSLCFTARCPRRKGATEIERSWAITRLCWDAEMTTPALFKPGHHGKSIPSVSSRKKRSLFDHTTADTEDQLLLRVTVLHTELWQRFGHVNNVSCESVGLCRWLLRTFFRGLFMEQAHTCHRWRSSDGFQLTATRIYVRSSWSAGALKDVPSVVHGFVPSGSSCRASSAAAPADLAAPRTVADVAPLPCKDGIMRCVHLAQPEPNVNTARAEEGTVQLQVSPVTTESDA